MNNFLVRFLFESIRLVKSPTTSGYCADSSFPVVIYRC